MTPLAGLIGCSNELLETSLLPNQKELAAFIQKCGQSMSNLITNLLDMSLLEFSKLKLTSQTFNIVEDIQFLKELTRVGFLRRSRFRILFEFFFCFMMMMKIYVWF